MTTTTAPIAMTMGANVLVDGKLLSGSELTDYAKQRGLCSKCVQQVTHKRLKKRLGMRSEWIPITAKDTQARNYIVYKGYCIQPTCHTLAEAKALLGESSSTRSMSTGRPRPSPSGESERAKSVSRPRQENNSHSRLAPTGYHSERQLTVNTRPKSPYHPDRQQSARSTSPYYPEPVQNSRSRDRQDVSLLRGLVRSRMDTVNHDVGDINSSFRSNASSDDISLGSIYTTDSESITVYSKASGFSSVQSSKRNLEKQPSSTSISDVSERSSSKHRRSSLVENNVLESTRDVHGTTRNAMRSSMFYRQPSISDSESNDDLTLDKSTNHSDEISQASKATRRQSIERVNLSNFITKSRRQDLIAEPGTATTVSEPENTPSKSGSRKSIKMDISHLFRSPPSSGEKEGLKSLLYPASTGLSLTNIQNQQAGNTKRRASISCLPPKSPLLTKTALSTFRSTSSTRNICRNDDKDTSSFKPKEFNTTGLPTQLQRDVGSHLLADHLLDDNSSSSREDIHPRIFTDATENDDFHSLSSHQRGDNFGGGRDVSSLVKSLFVPFSGSNDKSADGEADDSLPTVDELQRVHGEFVPADAEEVAAPDLKAILSMHYQSTQAATGIKTTQSHQQRDISLDGDGFSSQMVPQNEVEMEPRLIRAPSKENSETRRFMSDTSILEQLCSLIANKSTILGEQSVSTSSTDYLWTSLHTRYGDIALPVNTNPGKIAAVLNFLATVENDCLENGWTLISHLSKLGDTSDKLTLCSALGLAIVERARVEFERQDFTGNVKLLAAATLYTIIETEKATSDKKVTVWVQSMAKTSVLQWVAVLCDTLNFRDYSQSEQRSETADVIHLLCHLLDTEIVGFKEHYKNSEWIHSMNSLFEISISILSMDCFDSMSIINVEVREHGNSAALELCEAALHLMSSVLSQNTLSSVQGRQVECFRLILNTMNKYSCGGVMYQGLLSARHILTTCKSADSFNGGIYDDATSNVLVADKITEMALMAILYERHNPSQSLSIECISTVSRLFETNEIMRVIAEKSVIVQRPMLVEAILRLIDTSDDIMIIDKAFFLLLFHVTKCSISGMNLRQSKSIHIRVVEWLHRYQGDLSLLEYICLILEYLVASDEDSFGQEFCIAGGAIALGNLIRTSVRGSSIVLVPIAARALIETLSAVEKSFLAESWVKIKDDIIDAMSTDFKQVELQLACLNVIDCLLAQRSGAISDRSGTIDIMSRSMELHFEDTVLLSKCCSIIRKGSLCSGEFAAIAETDAIKKVVNMLITHPTSTDLLLEILVTIKELAAIKELRRYFNFDDAEVAIVSIFPIHMQNPEFVSFALAALRNVVLNPTNQNVALMQVDVLDYIIFAITEFRENCEVVTNACSLLDCYTNHDTNVHLIRSLSTPIKALLIELSEKPNTELRDLARHIIRKI